MNVNKMHESIHIHIRKYISSGALYYKNADNIVRTMFCDEKLMKQELIKQNCLFTN